MSSDQAAELIALVRALLSFASIASGVLIGICLIIIFETTRRKP